VLPGRIVHGRKPIRVVGEPLSYGGN
jgi:hypothetical protein